MNTAWEVADVRKPLISARPLLESGHKLVLDEKSRIKCRSGDVVPLRDARGATMDPTRFSSARLNVNRNMKRSL